MSADPRLEAAREYRRLARIYHAMGYPDLASQQYRIARKMIRSMRLNRVLNHNQRDHAAQG